MVEREWDWWRERVGVVEREGGSGRERVGVMEKREREEKRSENETGSPWWSIGFIIFTFLWDKRVRLKAVCALFNRPTGTPANPSIHQYLYCCFSAQPG